MKQHDSPEEKLIELKIIPIAKRRNRGSLKKKLQSEKQRDSKCSFFKQEKIDFFTQFMQAVVGFVTLKFIFD